MTVRKIVKPKTIDVEATESPIDDKNWDETISELIALQKAVVDANTLYKEKTRLVFGVEDGQPLNILQMAMLIRGITK